MKLLERLTDAFNKNPNSNIGKIFQLLTSQLDELTETFDQIEAWRVIENAEGDTLDNIGRDLGQYRGGATDEIYRIMLKSKTARDMSEGDTNTIIEVLSMAIDADPSEIGISETWLDENDPEPAGINLIEIPIRRLNEVGMSGRQFAQFVAGTVAAGVLVKQIELQGTFKYGGLIPLEGRNLLNTNFKNYNTGGTYGYITLVDKETDLTLKVYDKDTSVDMTSIYFGLTGAGYGSDDGVRWAMAGGSLTRDEIVHSEYRHFSYYPKNEETFNKIFERFYIKVEKGTQPTEYTTWEEGFESESDENAGFADIDQTVGGFLGALYTPSDDRDLPL